MYLQKRIPELIYYVYSAAYARINYLTVSEFEKINLRLL
jgi:hypothetical protein